MPAEKLDHGHSESNAIQQEDKKEYSTNQRKDIYNNTGQFKTATACLTMNRLTLMWEKAALMI